jgi:hypothetical protein
MEKEITLFWRHTCRQESVIVFKPHASLNASISHICGLSTRSVIFYETTLFGMNVRSSQFAEQTLVDRFFAKAVKSDLVLSSGSNVATVFRRLDLVSRISYPTCTRSLYSYIYTARTGANRRHCSKVIYLEDRLSSWIPRTATY